MKKVLVLIIILPIISCATAPTGYPFDEISGNFTYEDVIPVDDKDSDELHSTIINWISLSYNSAEDVIKLDDKTNHIIIVAGNFGTNLFGKKGWYPHTIKIESRDNRFKYTIVVTSYFSIGSGDMKFNSTSMGFKDTIFKDVDANVKATIESLSQYVIEGINSKDDSW